MRHRRKHTESEFNAATMSASDDEIGTQEASSTQDTVGFGRLLPLYLSHNIDKTAIHTNSTLWKEGLLNKMSIPSGITTPSQIPVTVTTNSSILGMSDLLGNLLGVEGSDIDTMLDSADSAAKLLGVKSKWINT